MNFKSHLLAAMAHKCDYSQSLFYLSFCPYLMLWHVIESQTFFSCKIDNMYVVCIRGLANTIYQLCGLGNTS